jgi:hypothetical protein
MARYAFVMGSNGPASLGKLKFAVSDANSLAAQLSQDLCGFTVVMPEQTDGTYAVQEKLDRLAARCCEADTFICYYSGHGMLDSGQLFLPWQHDEGDLVFGSLRVPNLLHTMGLCRAGNKLLVLDCCHAGAASGVKAAPIPVGEVVPADNHLVLMASPRLETARELDELKGGFLTTSICAALSDKFYLADKDHDQNISIADLMGWLEEAALAHNARSKEKVPIPFLYGQRKGPFMLTQNSAWSCHEIAWPDGTAMVVLPIRDPDYAVCIGKFPISNEQYRKHLGRQYRKSEPVGRALSLPLDPDAELKWYEGFHPWQEEAFDSPHLPVVCVSYHNAEAYCAWVNNQVKRTERRKGAVTFLPTPEIWMYSAFGTISVGRTPTSLFSPSERVHHLGEAPSAWDGDPSRVNGLGVVDTVGNVWEWCSGSPVRNLSVGFVFRGVPEIRGGGFADDIFAKDLVLQSRDLDRQLDTRHFDLGFRIAARVPLSLLPKAVRQQLKLRPRLSLNFQDFVETK